MMSPMGFFDSLGKGWSFTKASFAMARDNKRLMLPSLYQVLISIAYFIAWIAALVAIDPEWSDATWAIVGLIATFGSFMIFYFFAGVTVNMVDVHLKGGTPSIAEGARDARKNIVAIVFLALISTVVDAIVRAAGDSDSLVGKIVGAIINAVWTTLSFLLLPAIIIEDAGFRQAMRRVRELHKGHLMLIAVGDVGVGIITFLLGIVWVLLTVGVFYVGISSIGGTAGMVFAVAIAGALLSIYAAFSTFVRMAYYTCLYQWAVEVEAKGDQAPAPLPLAIALNRRAA